MRDLREHNAADNVAILVFTEFGRRIKDNGSGTDHGSGGGALSSARTYGGGLHSEYPPLAPADWLNGEGSAAHVRFPQRLRHIARAVAGPLIPHRSWRGVRAATVVPSRGCGR